MHPYLVTFGENHVDLLEANLFMSLGMRFPTIWYVRPAKAQISLRICAV